MTKQASSHTASRPADLRQHNTRVVLELLQAVSPCSRADLARLSGLSAPTVAASLSALEAFGLLESLGEGASSGGRKPALVRFNARHAFLAAADIGGTRLRMLLADLSGHAVADWSTRFTSHQRTPPAVCRVIREGLREMCRRARIPAKRVVHLTAGAPGITNATTGVVLAAPNLENWHDVPLQALLSAELGLPCIVENDTNLAAVGEHHRGAARHSHTFAFIALGTGVGAGLFLDGRLHRGAQWSAGEIGYFGLPGRHRTHVDAHALGQLETAIGGAGIEAEYHRLTGQAMRPTKIFDLAESGDRAASKVLRYTAAMLANAVADITLLLNPEMVVLGGGIGAHPGLCRATEKVLSRLTLHPPQLCTSVLGTQAQLHGALSLSRTAAFQTLIA